MMTASDWAEKWKRTYRQALIDLAACSNSVTVTEQCQSEYQITFEASQGKLR
jgi:hypothetical protein